MDKGLEVDTQAV